MEAQSKGGMALYYKKLLELQDKLRERERAHCKKLQFQCRKLIDKDRKRQERNEEIVRSLEEIEMRMCRLASKTKNFETFKFPNNHSQKYQDIQGGRAEWKGTLPTSNYGNLGTRDGKTHLKTTDSNLDKNPHRFNKTSDDLNTLAEYMTNSISSRYYKKDGYESNPYQIQTIHPNIENFEKGIYDEFENQKTSKDFDSYCPDVPKSYRTQIGEKDAFVELEKNTVFGKTLEELNDNKQGIDDMSLNGDAKAHNRIDINALVNKGGMNSNQDPLRSEIVKSTENQLGDSNGRQRTDNMENVYVPDKNTEDFSKKQHSTNEVKISRDSCKKDMPERNTKIARQSVESPPKNENLETKRKNYLSYDHEIVETYPSNRITDKTNSDVYPEEKTKLDRHEETQVKQQFYPDESAHLDQHFSGTKPNEPNERNDFEGVHETYGDYPTNRQSSESNPSEGPFNYPDESTGLDQQCNEEQSNQFLDTQYEKPPGEIFAENKQPFDKQYDVQSTLGMNPEMGYDAPVQSSIQSLCDDGTKDSDQYVDIGSYHTDNHELHYEENAGIAIHSGKTQEIETTEQSHHQEQFETTKPHQGAGESDGVGKETEVTTGNARAELEFSNDHLGEQVPTSIMNVESAIISEDQADTKQVRNGDRNQPQDLDPPCDYQFEPQMQHSEGVGQQEYDENGLPILQYDENGQLLQQYDQNAVYQYEQQYDNSTHDYGENNQGYQQQYGQYDDGQIYQQTEGMHPTGDEAQLYMNQVGQYDELNQPLQDYQYTEGMNTNGEENGIYQDQDGLYTDQQQPQTYQSSGEVDASCEKSDVYMSQVKRYEQIDHEAAQQPDENLTDVDGHVEQSSIDIAESSGKMDNV